MTHDIKFSTKIPEVAGYYWWKPESSASAEPIKFEISVEADGVKQYCILQCGDDRPILHENGETLFGEDFGLFGPKLAVPNA